MALAVRCGVVVILCVFSVELLHAGSTHACSLCNYSIACLLQTILDRHGLLLGIVSVVIIQFSVCMWPCIHEQCGQTLAAGFRPGSDMHTAAAFS